MRLIGPIRSCLSIVGLTLLSTMARGEDVVTLQALVRQWVDLRTEIAESQRVWSEQEAAWRQEIDVLKEEQERLQGALEDEAKQHDAELTDRGELAIRGNELRAILNELAEILDSAGEENPPGTLSISQRMQRALSAFAERDDLHHTIQVSRQLVELMPGKRKEVNVLCIGLARAFAVSDANDWAAVGTFHAGEWTWMPRPEIAGAVRQAIAIHAHDKPAAFVHLPLQAKENGP